MPRKYTPVIPRRQRIHRVLSLLSDYIPKKMLEEIDTLLMEMYKELSNASQHIAGISVDDRRDDLESNRVFSLQELDVGECILIDSPRVAAARQHIWRLRHEFGGKFKHMHFETKKMPFQKHRVTRTQ